MDTDPFVLACLHAPLDAGPRLAFSDWLEEHKGWDALRLAALRGEGEWMLLGDIVIWRFSIQRLIRSLYPRDQLNIVGDAGSSELRLGKVVAGGPACINHPDRTGHLGLFDPNWKLGDGGVGKKWHCTECRAYRPGTAYGVSGLAPAYSMSYIQMPLPSPDGLTLVMHPDVAAQFAQAMQAGVQIPEPEARDALGLPETPDDE
jgi:uncharacterized protein (TIGR02996 family)